MEFLGALISICDSAIRLSVPLLLACLAGLYSERSGVFDIGLEGKMLGAIWRTMMRRSLAPRILAARTYSFWRSARVTPRDTRA